MIEYDVGDSRQKLVLLDSVLDHFCRHRQLCPCQKEAGGQLFARLLPLQILVEEATGPCHTDLRTQTSYVPNRDVEQHEIFERHAIGLHYIGDWHTHPEKYAMFSCSDRMSIAECYAKSIHQLNAFVLIVVGIADAPNGLNVSIHNSKESFVLSLSNNCNGSSTW